MLSLRTLSNCAFKSSTLKLRFVKDCADENDLPSCNLFTLLVCQQKKSAPLPPKDLHYLVLFIWSMSSVRILDHAKTTSYPYGTIFIECILPFFACCFEFVKSKTVIYDMNQLEMSFPVFCSRVSYGYFLIHNLFSCWLVAPRLADICVKNLFAFLTSYSLHF